MPEIDYIHRGVTEDGETLCIEFLVGPSLRLTRDEAYALFLVLQEQLPNMAQKIDP